MLFNSCPLSLPQFSNPLRFPRITPQVRLSMRILVSLPEAGGTPTTVVTHLSQEHTYVPTCTCAPAYTQWIILVCGGHTLRWPPTSHTPCIIPSPWVQVELVTFLTNKIGQEWWDSHSCIYVTLQETRKRDSPISSHGKELRWSLRPGSCLWTAASKKMVTSVLQPQGHEFCSQPESGWQQILPTKGLPIRM